MKVKVSFIQSSGGANKYQKNVKSTLDTEALWRFKPVAPTRFEDM